MNDFVKVGAWSAAGQTQTAGTAIAIPIFPFTGPPGSSPHLFSYSSSGGLNVGVPGAVTHVSQFVVNSNSTAHTWYFLRPKNFTYIADAVTKNDTTIAMFDSPGLYATKYKYPLPAGVSGVPGLVADNAPASGDYVMFQLDNGAWHFSAVSSLSSLTLTIGTGTPNVDGSTAAVGRILYFFAAGGDKDPATGLIDPCILPAVSATTTFGDGRGSIVSALRPGDPLVLVNANATGASIACSLSGFYARP